MIDNLSMLLCLNRTIKKSKIILKILMICFQYAFVTTQAYKEIKNHPEQVLNIKHFLIYSIGWVPNIQQPEIKIIILYFKKITPKLL